MVGVAAPLATVEDVQSNFRALTEEEAGLARNALILASALVRSSAARVDDRIADGTLDPEVVKAIVVSAILRALRNPEGARNRSETVGPFSTSLTFGDDVANLALLPSELRLLTASPRGRVNGLGTMRVASGYPSTPPTNLPPPIGRHPE